LDRREAAQQELQLMWEKIARIHYELTWFPFKVGQLGVISQLGDVDEARAFIDSMRKDINDLMDATEAAALQMGHLLKNVEDALDENNEPEVA
jgi:hypothetical protein